MMRLRELQETFAAVAMGSTSTEPLKGVLGDSADASRARVHVYVDAYLARLRDVLLDDYPKLGGAVGEAFAALSRQYIRVHPSDRPSLRHFGRHVPAFLLKHPLSEQRPWLADLARLEWARVEAFDAADRQAMSAEDLHAMAGEGLAQLRLKLVPSVQVLELAWPADAIWQALDDGEAPMPVVSEPTTLVVWRSGFSVRHRRCDVPEARAIARVSRAAAFAEVCEAWDEEPRTDIATAAARATAALCQWVVDGWIVSGVNG
jgi:hypothetical protein